MTFGEGQKAEARQVARTQRAAAHAAASEENGALISLANRLLVKFLSPFQGETVAGYMPIRTELTPLPAMHDLAARGPVAVPVIEQTSAPLRFDLWEPDGDMVEGKFGAHIPSTSKPVIPRVVIVPMLAYNATGHRLGYGGGFYDRTLEKLRAAGDVLAVGFAYAGQHLETFPYEDTDEVLDAIVTERGITTFRP